jgi:uncharacterized OsmC-like protein
MRRSVTFGGISMTTEATAKATATDGIAQALRRVEAVLQRRPEVGEHDDAPAVAHWQSGTNVVTSHANGTRVASDMPAEFGGGGAHVTPGWLLRAGFASCTATCIAMHAALEGIELGMLEVQASSRSDSRGLLGMAGSDGAPVSAGPHDVRLQVRISARGVDEQRLRALVERSYACSPMGCAMREAVPVELLVDVTND